MARFLALTSRGLFDVLESELKGFGFETEKTPDGVYFEADWAGCYRVNLWSRVATRVLFPVTEFTAENTDELYENMKSIDFGIWIDSNQTLSVEGNVRDSRFRDKRFVALKAKDAIVDRFREETGERPSVDRYDPHLRVFVRVVNQIVSVSIDTSGETLSKRGYRKKTGDAPLKEHLAAGLILMTDWDKKSPIVDPMCGTGTFLIEGAMIAMNMAPGLLRKSFGFEKLKNFDSEIWSSLIDEATASEIEELDFKFYGSDRNGGAIETTALNARHAGVDEAIELVKCAIDELECPTDSGVVITNPPYGERIGDKDRLKDDYKDISYVLKNRFQGWTAYILSGEPELTKNLGMRSDIKIPVSNGPINCRFLKYVVNKAERPE